MSDPIFQFDRFEVRPALRQLRVNGKVAALGARAFDLLLALIERRDHLVTKNELLDIVWPGLVVEENNLTVQISTLRKLLGADVIATIPGRGYRFTAQSIDGAGRTGDPVADVETRAAGMLRTNLPEALPPLIGRDDDLAALGALLGEHRLITITGAGGIGKTRLAERVLHERRSAYPHGVAWVELAGLADPALLPGTIAGALGLQMGPGEPLPALVRALQSLQILVALDNAEHLLDGVARVVQAVLDATAHVRLVVTSQVPLRLPRERVYRLEGLALPEVDTPMDEAVHFGAVALFIERACAADRRFEATAQTLPAITAICAQLDGVALAIELAAARVTVLGVSALATSLDQRLRLLTQGRRGAPERQRTLRAALEWSHGLLNEVEATVFYRLGVFVGGFSLEMACQLAADNGPIDEWAVVDALGALVDRALVAVDMAETPRYRLLESARALALERLAAANENPTMVRRHLRVVLARFLEVGAACADGRQGVDMAVAALEPDLDNARAAIRAALDAGDSLSAVTLAPAMSFALTPARSDERDRLWQWTRERVVDPDLPAAVKASWAMRFAFTWYTRDTGLAMQWARQAIEIWRQQNDRRGLHFALGALSHAAARVLHLDECAAAVEELSRIEDPVWPPRRKFFGAIAALALHISSGDIERARLAALRARTLAIASGNSMDAELLLVRLADLDLASGRVEDAVRGGLELEQRLRAGRWPHILTAARVNLTGALLAQGNIVQGRAMARASWPLAKPFHVLTYLVDNLALLAAMEQRAQDSARLRGYADELYAKSGAARELTERTTVERAARLAREQIDDVEFERLRIEGASLRDDQILPLALGADGTV